MVITIGYILKEIRIRRRLTLETFCLKRDLDVVRYSMIEHGQSTPTESELEKYLRLIGKRKKMKEDGAVHKIFRESY